MTLPHGDSRADECKSQRHTRPREGPWEGAWSRGDIYLSFLLSHCATSEMLENGEENETPIAFNLATSEVQS